MSIIYSFLVLILGANIGTTVTALLAALSTDSSFGLQIALVHVLFNVIGMLMLYPIPLVRRIPIRCAEILGDAVYERYSHSFHHSWVTVGWGGGGVQLERECGRVKIKGKRYCCSTAQCVPFSLLFCYFGQMSFLGVFLLILLNCWKWSWEWRTTSMKKPGIPTVVLRVVSPAHLSIVVNRTPVAKNAAPHLLQRGTFCTTLSTFCRWVIKMDAPEVWAHFMVLKISNFMRFLFITNV